MREAKKFKEKDRAQPSEAREPAILGDKRKGLYRAKRALANSNEENRVLGMYSQKSATGT
jgi:hypothetical protein